MPDPIFTAILTSSLITGVAVAIINHLLNRKKSKTDILKVQEEIKQIRLANEQRMLEIDNLKKQVSTSADNIAAVSYELSNVSEKMIYDSTKREIGFDFKTSEGKIWKRIDGKDVAMTELGSGKVEFNKGIINVERKNTTGRIELLLQSYTIDGVEKQVIPRDTATDGNRRIRLSFEVKTIGAEHTLKFVFKNNTTHKWLGSGERKISEKNWTPYTLHFLVSREEDCQLRIDDQDVTEAPSNLLIRNLMMTERISP